MHYTFLIKQAAQRGSRVPLPRSINYESNGDKWTDAETGKALTPAQVLVAKRDAMEYKQRLRDIGAYKKADVLDNRASAYRGIPQPASQPATMPGPQPVRPSVRGIPQPASQPATTPVPQPVRPSVRPAIAPISRSRQAMEDEANAWAYGQAQKSLANTKDAYHWTPEQWHQFNMRHGLSERDERGNIVTPEMMRQREIAMMPTTSSKAKPEGGINITQRVRAPGIVNRKTRKPVRRTVKKRIRNATGMWNDRNGGVITFGNVSPTDVARASGNMGVGRNAPYSGRYSYRTV